MSYELTDIDGDALIVGDVVALASDSDIKLTIIEAHPNNIATMSFVSDPDRLVHNVNAGIFRFYSRDAEAIRRMTQVSFNNRAEFVQKLRELRAVDDPEALDAILTSLTANVDHLVGLARSRVQRTIERVGNLEVRFKKCPNCGDWMHKKDRRFRTISGKIVCHRCAERLPKVRGVLYESAVWDELNNGEIRNYTYRATNAFPNIFSHTDRPVRPTGMPAKDGENYALFGVELEVGFRPEADILAHRIIQRVKMKHGALIAKSDASIRSPGCEFVTAPMTMTAQMEAWKDAAEPLVEYCRATESCGLHVHISRMALTPLTLGKMLQFVNDPANHDFIERVGGRNPSGHQYGRTDSQLKVKDVLRPNGLRFSAVNVEPSNTIELRFFASTVDSVKLLGRIEFADALVKFCRYASLRELNGQAMAEYVTKHRGEFRNVFKYFLSLGLVQK